VQPNVLFITVDQWRGECLSALNHPVVQTPNLDRLAARGTLFRRHYSQATPCGPSRASIWTGLYTHNHRSVFNGTPLDDRFTNLAREARALGYDPTLFGYTDTTLDPRTIAEDDPRLTSYEEVLPGFSVGVQLADDHAAWIDWMAEKGYDIEDHEAFISPDSTHPGAAERGATWAPPPFPAECTETAFLTEAAIDHLATISADTPWFVHMSYLRPHPPFVVPEPYNDMYDPADVAMPTRLATPEDEAAVHPLVANTTMLTARHLIDNELDLRQLRATYYGMMTEVDHQVGRLLDAVESRDDGARTIVVLTSDHGEMLGDHWMTSKFSFHEQSFHIPLIVAGPDVLAGATVDHFTENVDLAPTLVEMLGGDVPVQFDGRSLVPLLSPGVDRTQLAWRDAAHWTFDFRVFARGTGIPLADATLDVLRDDHGMYVHVAGMDALFFDLEEDPGALVNLAADPTRAGEVISYAQRLLSWRQRHADQTLANLLASPKGMRRMRSEG
jgi:arylsulfatase A-like enzyme